MRKLVFLFFIIFIAFTNIKAQQAIGARLSDNFGITYKYTYSNPVKLEGILEIHRHALTVNGLYERYYQTPFSKYFDWYFGGGAFINFWSVNDNGGVNVGLRGVAGICYTFSDIPIDISLDWMPAIQIVSDYHADFAILGLSVRYVF
ncbi:MAG TPA: hypothetical protein PK252_01490 [Bacteroidales bacterium]|nr:hypothetical protein [Bacteroidales bacterium]